MNLNPKLPVETIKALTCPISNKEPVVGRIWLGKDGWYRKVSVWVGVGYNNLLMKEGSDLEWYFV